MEIAFETERLARLFNSGPTLDRMYGTACARRVRQRLQELEAVESLVVPIDADRLKSRQRVSRVGPHQAEQHAQGGGLA